MVLGISYCTPATPDVVTMRLGDFRSSENALMVSWIGVIAFAVYGGRRRLTCRQ
ncbi:hypothetical protein [Streptomyces sp. NPDC058572]|uniref:hypothetical protein n=1 Tax=Streptomyces sp. NPDC058572 TaxID=3346546 RepID=UPI003667F9AD